MKDVAALAFGWHASEELYDLRNDPEQLLNIVGDRAYELIRKQLRQQLDAELIKANDPRVRTAEQRVRFQ